MLVSSVVSVRSNYIGIGFFHSYLKMLFMILFAWKKNKVLGIAKGTEGKALHYGNTLAFVF